MSTSAAESTSIRRRAYTERFTKPNTLRTKAIHKTQNKLTPELGRKAKKNQKNSPISSEPATMSPYINPETKKMMEEKLGNIELEKILSHKNAIFYITLFQDPYRRNDVIDKIGTDLLTKTIQYENPTQLIKLIESPTTWNELENELGTNAIKRIIDNSVDPKEIFDIVLSKTKNTWVTIRLKLGKSSAVKLLQKKFAKSLIHLLTKETLWKKIKERLDIETIIKIFEGNETRRNIELVLNDRTWRSLKSRLPILKINTFGELLDKKNKDLLLKLMTTEILWGKTKKLNEKLDIETIIKMYEDPVDSKKTELVLNDRTWESIKTRLPLFKIKTFSDLLEHENKELILDNITSELYWNRIERRVGIETFIDVLNREYKSEVCEIITSEKYWPELVKQLGQENVREIIKKDQSPQNLIRAIK